jgi:histidine triad (HIT) family protein
VTSESDCLFCKMASGTIPVEKVYEDADLFAIADIAPRAPTHLLVIPKQHIPTAGDIQAGHGPLLAQMILTAKRLMDERGISSRGYRLTINVGEDGGQSVFHLHMHVLGGRKLGPEG